MIFCSILEEDTSWYWSIIEKSLMIMSRLTDWLVNSLNIWICRSLGKFLNETLSSARIQLRHSKLTSHIWNIAMLCYNNKSTQCYWPTLVKHGPPSPVCVTMITITGSWSCFMPGSGGLPPIFSRAWIISNWNKPNDGCDQKATIIKQQIRIARNIKPQNHFWPRTNKNLSERLVLLSLIMNAGFW